MEGLKTIKKTLIAAVQGQIGDLGNVDAHEMGEVVDMIKDLEEACYYHTIVEAMEEKDEHGKRRYFRELPYYPNPMYDRDRYEQNEPYRMYYRDRRGTRMNSGRYSEYDDAIGPYRETKVPTMKRDSREGRSGLSRKGYIEAREGHLDKETKMKELDKYMNDLTQDIVEMINDLSQEEKDLLRNKMAGLVNRI